ncbi:3-oxoacyl-[acyl-carrier protein] reductase [Comamonas odontotermitis]|uniref:3-oxoacyl-[acyl-carrier protein] reductase n=1 Tax=Comamonas odontotermitis TaxID=379895 RepID=A0ABR6RBC4_9BURK|nr:SDR family oxidoreductase [Comamonas odontotermitis]MBB6576453.1 3-oxoacyl-[acyl-carrier protein] reductase [Comamonas odontotermitis]
MDLELNGKSALVWGGSKGMGYAAARRLALEGANVVIAARTEATLQEAAQALSQDCGRTVRCVVADITSNAGREAALAACPQPDILVNNSDGYPPGDFREWTQQTWHEALDMMMVGPIDMIRRVVDGMQERCYGRIINIVSRSVKVAHAELGLSNGARSGLVGFVAGLARQTVRHNVTINNVLPGAFDTDAQARHIDKLARQSGKPADEVRRSREAGNPAGRFGRPDEVGALIAYLASAHTGYITGQSWLIDGGEYPGTY